MKRISIIVMLLTCCLAQRVSAWNRTAHEAIACIAEHHITPAVKDSLEKYLDGRSIVYYATWMDHKHDHFPYKHTVAVTSKNKLVPLSKRADVDAMNAIEKSLDRLKNRHLHPKDTVALDIKFMVHLIADIHCPGHIVYPKTARFFPVKLMGKTKKYHHIWDAMLDNNHAWSYREWQEQLDRLPQERIDGMAAGVPAGWAQWSAERCRVIYQWAQKDDELDRSFINKAYPLAEDMVLHASYRLAKLLNDIFGE